MRGGGVKTSRKNGSQIYKSGHRSMILSSLISRLRKPLHLTEVKYASQGVASTELQTEDVAYFGNCIQD